MTKWIVRCPAVLACALVVFPGHAAEVTGPDLVSSWSVGAYGTLGYSLLGTEGPYTFIRELGQGSGSARARSWLPDSRVALQVGKKINAQTDAVVQVVARDKVKANLKNSIEWAYVSHRPTENLNVRVGRVGVDVFLLSDYRSLGYAQTTVRPNVEFYGFQPFYALDGVDATYTHTTAAARWSLKSQFGRTQTDVALFDGSALHLVANNVVDVTLTRESGPWRLKAGVSSIKTPNDAAPLPLKDPLLAVAALGLPGISQEAAELARGMEVKGARFNYASVGTSFDDNVWSVQAELCRVTVDQKILVSGSAAYLTVGRRFASVMPFASVSRFLPDREATVAQHNWSAFLGPQAGVLQAVSVRATDTARIEQRTVSLGARWDFHPQAALKIQWDRFHIQSSGYGLWRSDVSATLNEGRMSMVTASIDWTF